MSEIKYVDFRSNIKASDIDERHVHSFHWNNGETDYLYFNPEVWKFVEQLVENSRAKALWDALEQENDELRAKLEAAEKLCKKAAEVITFDKWDEDYERLSLLHNELKAVGDTNG